MFAQEATVAVKPYDLSNISNLQSVALDIFEVRFVALRPLW
jgi:hypothetical protein